MKEKIFVFVYGTLRKDGKYHHFLKGAVLISNDSWTYGKLFDTKKGYPVLVIDGCTKVIGEVYEVSKEMLKTLDELEGYHGKNSINHYDRITQSVFTKQGPVHAYVYVYPLYKSRNLEQIKSGVWQR